MMKLEKMAEFVVRLNRHAAGPIGDAILQPWPHGRSHARYIRVSANFILGYTLGGDRHILRQTTSPNEVQRTIRRRWTAWSTWP